MQQWLLSQMCSVGACAACGDRDEEIRELVSIFTDLGVDNVRLTGGEPLLRRDLPGLVRMLCENPRIQDLALTTNGVQLAEHAQVLRDAGLHRITLSLDTLRADRTHL